MAQLDESIYPYVPEGRTFIHVPEDNIFILEAKRVCLDCSTDHNHPTGSVVVKDGVIIGRAANQSALKNPKLIEFHQKKFCVRRFLKIKTGTHYWLCPGCASYRLHSEAGAIKDAKKSGNDPNGADLYLWGHWWCCKPCWDKIIAAGIRNIYLLKNSEKLFNKNHPENIVGK